MRFFIGIVVSLFLAVGLMASKLDSLHIMTENYPPHNMLKDGKLVGIATEILDIILKNTNSKLTSKDAKVLPWARAYSIAQKKPNSMLFSMVRTEAREKLFKWAGPIDVSNIGLIALKSRNIKIKEFKELDNYKIGTVKDDVGELLLKDMGYDMGKVDSLSGLDSIAESIRKLQAKRIDLFSYVLEMNSWDVKDFNPEDFEPVYILKSNNLCFAFNLKTDDAIVELFQKELDKLNKDGTVEKIIKKYK
jgi:polar amino acid transport system substrate-binding protein